jgi:hypothetical protein
MKALEPARQFLVSPLPSRLVTTAPALPGQGSGVFGLWYRGRMVRVSHINMAPDGPLTAEKTVCRADVWKSYYGWWRWECDCGDSRSPYTSWRKAYRSAYVHVRLARLRETMIELETEEKENDCYDD